MKKSKVKIEEFLKDVNNVLDLVSKVDSLDPEKTDINKFNSFLLNFSKFLIKYLSYMMSVSFVPE